MANDDDKMLTTYSADGVEVKLTKGIVFRYLASGNPDALSDADIALFIKLCEARRLNPFLREAYLIKYSNDKREPATMVVAKDVLMKRAAKFAHFDGMESGVITLNEAGELRDRIGEFYVPGKETLVGGWARGHRKDWSYPIEARVQLDEYIGKTREGKPNKMWSSKPATMIVKVAEAHALRRLIPEELPGMYIPEEMEVLDQLEKKPIEIAVAEREIPDIEQARIEINKLIDRYRPVLAEAYLANLEMELEGADVERMRTLYLDLKHEGKAAEAEAEGGRGKIAAGKAMKAHIEATKLADEAEPVLPDGDPVENDLEPDDHADEQELF